MIEFYSKRNHVFLSKGNVIKIYINEFDFYREKKVYQKMEEALFLNKPKMIEDNGKNKLILEYLEGPTILELLEKCEHQLDVDLAVMVLKEILQWLDAFYEIFNGENQVMGDVNLRNFIWYKDTVYGIDFEKSCPGNSTNEKAEVIARYLLYDPIESDFKMKVFNVLVEQLYVSEEFKIKVDQIKKEIKIRRANG